ncbi:MAG: SLC13 family permease [Peptococcaceae bacterium]|nr:SLC13 family permease [Peptococcaceae bacterium]
MSSEKTGRIPIGVHIILTIVLMFGIGFLPPVSALTVSGMKILGILVGTIYGVTFCAPAWPCLLAMVAMGVLGVAPVGTILSSGMGSDSIMLMIFFFIFVAVLDQNKITEFLASWMITRKVVKGRPWLFSYIMIIGTMFAGAIGSSYPAMIVFWGILISVCHMYDIKPFTKYPTVMFVGITIGGLASSSTWLFRGNPLFVNAMLMQIIEGKLSLNFGIYAFFSFAMWMVVIAGYILLCKYLFRIDLGKMSNIDDSVIDKSNLTLNKRQKITFAYVLLVLVIYCGMGFTPSQSALGQYFANLGVTLPICLILALMSITIIDGKPILDLPKAATQGVVWDTILLSGALLALSMIMMTADTGVSESILALLGPVFNGKGPIFMCIIIVLVAVVLTNFMANTTVGLMFTPVIYSFSQSMGFDPMPLMAMMLVSIHIAYLTPAASPFASLLFGNSGWVKANDLYKYGAVACVGMVIVFLIVGIPLSQLLF